MRILEFVLLFAILIITHEFGHFLVARLLKVEVEEFGIGFPPRLAKLFRLWGTDFTLNLIPLGGFVRPKGENDPEQPGGMAASPPLTRLAILLAGSAANILTGVLVFSLIFSRAGVPVRDTVQIMAVNEGSPAAQAGILTGDVVTSVNGVAINSMESLSKQVSTNLGKEITLAVNRNQEAMTFQLTPRENPPAGQGALGITMGYPTKDISYIQAIPYGFNMAYEQAKALITLPVQLIRGTIDPAAARMVGPVGIYSIFSQSRDLDQSEAASSSETAGMNTLSLFAVLAIAIGFTNLLPIPALDGGRILFLLPELLFKKRVPAQYENLVHFIGFALLMILMVYITFQDIANPLLAP